MAAVAVAPNPDVLDSPLPVLPEHIRANRGTVTKSRLGWLKSTSANTPIEEVRQILEEVGYVWIKGLLPREDVLKMREHYFLQFHGTGLLRPGTAPVDGIYNSEDDVLLHSGVGGGNPKGQEELRRLTAAHTTEHYEKFTDHPKLREMVRAMMGWEQEIMLRRTLLRHNVPGGDSTGIHYDRLFLRSGSAYFLTAWVPIGDISLAGGGLYYLSDSVGLGQAIEDDYNERARAFTPEQKINAFNRNMDSTGYLANYPQQFAKVHQRVSEKEGMPEDRYKWLIGEFEAGDVIFHHPCIIHGSLGNDDAEGRIRLSTDLRFYDRKDFDRGEADNRWMNYWAVDDNL